jgi:hypothetical protein
MAYDCRNSAGQDAQISRLCGQGDEFAAFQPIKCKRFPASLGKIAGYLTSRELGQRVRPPLCNRVAGCTAHPRSAVGHFLPLPRRNIDGRFTSMSRRCAPVASENPIQLTRGRWRIRTSSPHDCNRPPVRPHAVRLLQAATTAGSRDPGAAAASAQCPATARATATASSLGRSCSIHLALSSLPSHP